MCPILGVHSIEMVMGLEDIYGIKVTDEAVKDWKNIGHAIDYIRKQPQYDPKREYSGAIDREMKV